LYTCELNSLADTRKKEEVMLSLFLVAAVDKNISPEENKELRLISKSLGFNESDFYEFRMGSLARKLQGEELQNPNVVKVWIDSSGRAVYFSRQLHKDGAGELFA